MNDDQEALENRYFELHWEWHHYFDSDPDRVIAMLEEAINIAEQLGQDLWRMESRHWLAQTIIFKKRDYVKGLPLAVQSAVEARKPHYQGWSTRICLYQDLIAAHVGTDPVSYQETIETALDHMQKEAPPESQCTQCLAGERAMFELRRGDINAAMLASQSYLSKADNSHHGSNAHIYLSYLAFLQNDWAAMLSHAETAEKLGRDNQSQDNIVEGLILQAVAHLELGAVEQAKHCFAQSESVRALCNVIFGMRYWTIRVAYYELLDDLDAAIEARQSHLTSINGLGALREEAEAWLDLCRLQKQKGDIPHESVQQTRAAIERLQVKGDLPDKLEQVL